ncbi:MAG: DNA polymerase III subunit gamma/tau [Bacteroidia bacterium]
MEKFIVSARKYRPQTFRTVVGQSHITNTLKNAILNNHLAQAFLFCGPRGVGKTTCARILAKTINCFSITADGEACDKCESCVSFNTGASLNVHELDAASNNSVDDIRNLVDQVRFAPQLGEYKVYIIDEVHMLSSAAFNAFLKTLEEPPKHAIFILATTEKHKILPTILSRCQIFDFNRIKVDDIADHLAYIAQTEHITAEPDALHIIAQKADGGLRDACSIFDQMVSFAGNNLTYKAVVENLHVLDYDYYFKVTDALQNQQLPQVMLIYDEILKNGFEGHNFIVGLGEHFRNLLVCKDAATVQLLEVSQNIREKYVQQSQSCAMPFLLKALGIINRCDINYKAAKNQRLQVEIALMQMSFLNAPSLDGEKKNDLESLDGNTAVEKQNKQSSANIQSFQSSRQEVIQKTTSKPVTSFKDLNIKVGFSLNQAAQQTLVKQGEAELTEVKENTAAPLIENQSFSLEEMQAAVKKYAELKLATGQRQVHTTLTAKVPQLENETEIILLIENEVQREGFHQHKQDFLDFLRRELSNNQVSLSLRESDLPGVKKAYTPIEKFESLKAKNPLLLEMKKRLDLEIDY